MREGGVPWKLETIGTSFCIEKLIDTHTHFELMLH